MKLLSQQDEHFQAYYDKVYQGAPLLKSPTEAAQLAARQEGICGAYGELLYYSTQKISNRLSLTENDVFCDLGSGLGKCALQIFMQTPVKRVMAIEADQAMVAKSLQVCQTIKQDFPFFWDSGRTINILQDNFVTCDWQSPTVVYSCSTCFDLSLLTQIGDKINNTPSIRQALSLRPLPTLTRLKCIDIFRVECSWDSALCYHYQAHPQ